MVDPAVVRRRLRRLDEIVSRLSALASEGEEVFLNDDMRQAAAERLLQVGIQIVLDIGAHVLSERGVLDWEEYRQIPERLAAENVISAALADRLAMAAGQRNLLVHLYLEVDPALIFATLTNDLATFERFATAILTLLDDHAS